MCFFPDQNICAILFCGEKFVTLDTDTKRVPSVFTPRWGQILKERREMNETAEITCRMCDVVLRYAVSDAVPDDRGIRRVACGRCTFVNELSNNVFVGEREKKMPLSETRKSVLDDDEALARRLQKEEEAKAKNNNSRDETSWMDDLFSALSVGNKKRSKDETPTCAKCLREVSEVGEGERLTMFSRTVRYYQTSEYWNEYLCQECFENKRSLVRCDGCQKIESERCKRESGGFVRLPDEEHPAHTNVDLMDGRYLCLECSGSVVVDNEDAWILYEEIKRFMVNELGLTMPDVMPPLHVVTEESMRLSMARDENTTAHVYDEEGGAQPRDNDFRNTRTRGLCLSTEHTLTRVMRRPEFSWQEGLTFSETPIRLGSRSSVTAIIVVNCLPRLLFGSILAHEMTHAHFRLTPGYPQKIDPKVEEGLCQLVACIWTEREAQKVDGNDEEAKNQLALAGCIAHNIRTDPSEIYGDGARMALHRYEKLGNCRDVFDVVKNTGRLPEC